MSSNAQSDYVREHPSTLSFDATTLDNHPMTRRHLARNTAFSGDWLPRPIWMTYLSPRQLQNLAGLQIWGRDWADDCAASCC